jgi:MFS transporter, DHA3 family, tetracycline resistance protein
VLRPVLYPLVNGWMVGRMEPQIRVTALSAKDVFDSAGQIIGGPVVGVIGNLASIRAALLAGAAALGPAAAFLAAAGRRIKPRTAAVAEAETEDAAVPLGNPGLPG